ncbi:MAG: polyhydroxyalkanoate synthesis repressor PhaR [Burkholderiaceae bacterium]
MSSNKPEPERSDRRIIKKYPNRRLYDTNSSAYITVSEVRQLVMDCEPFVVIDAKTGEDLTRSILLQIILEQEANGSPMFTAPVLSNIIRFYGHTMQGFMGGYLEKNMQTLMDVQMRLGEQSEKMTPDVWKQFMNMQLPVVQGMLGSNLDQSKNLLTQLQEQMQQQTELVLNSFGLKR